MYFDVNTFFFFINKIFILIFYHFDNSIIFNITIDYFLIRKSIISLIENLWTSSNLSIDFLFSFLSSII